MLTKRCTKCGQEKPTSEFHVNAAKKDGRCDWCKTCRNRTDRRRLHCPGDTLRTKTCRRCGQVSQGVSLEVTVDGWLRSQRGQAVVVADRVMVHVSDAVRQEAGRLVDRLLALAMGRILGLDTQIEDTEDDDDRLDPHPTTERR